MEQNFYIRVKFDDRKKWVRVSGNAKDDFDTAVKQAFDISLEENINFYDEWGYEIDDDIFMDFIWFSPRGVTLQIKSADENLISLPSTPTTSGSNATTATNTSGLSEVPCSVVLAESLSPLPEKEFYKSSANKDLKAELLRFPEGRNILKEFEKTNQLTISLRKKLTNIVVSIIIEKHGNYPKKEIKVKYAEAIVKIFTCYYDNGTGSELFFDPVTRTGFLETRFRTINRNSVPQPKKTAPSTSSSCTETEVTENSEVEESISFLNTACVKTQKEEIFEHMVKTFNHRKNIDSLLILTTYPRFKDTPGLIAQDFYLHFQNGRTLSNEFAGFAVRILKVATELGHEPPSDWDEDINTLLSLLYLFPPTARGRGGIKKASVIEAIERLIVYYDVSTNLLEVLKEKKNTQPYIAAIGLSKKTIINYFIIVDTTPIPTKSTTPLGAFDELFQSHFVFKAKYDPLLKSFWTFIQKDIYKLESNKFVTLTPKEREIRTKIYNLTDT